MTPRQEEELNKFFREEDKNYKQDLKILKQGLKKLVTVQRHANSSIVIGSDTTNKEESSEVAIK
ncbi:MAG: hypothetical protein KKF89_00790 [Nanoarchaeota archaeon]|nr:hypothetical protein [Nanoarchaeota archaeon]MBU1854233.1 hypothetical protein [Nanoarchaeota archaeon]